MSNDEAAGPTLEAPDDAELLVADPDNYQRTKLLETIHDAREKAQQRYDWEKHEYAQAVAQYGDELHPVITRGLRNGALTEDDLTVELGGETVVVTQFIAMGGGLVPDDGGRVEFAPKQLSRAVYRTLTDIQYELGLGLDLEESGADEWEI